MMRHVADGADHLYLALCNDFRKQQNGLTSLVALKFKLNPHSGANVFLSAIKDTTHCVHYAGWKRIYSGDKITF